MIRLMFVLAAVAALSSGRWAQAPASAPASASGWTPPPGQLTMAIWPGTAPGEIANMPPQVNVNANGARTAAGRPYIRLTNVSTPTITLFKPTGKSTGAAVVVFPGGSYKILSMDLEGAEVCDWLNSIGVTCVLLKYRVPDSGPYPRSAAALQDAQRAMGLVRQHAGEWGIDPHRVGVIGFSAGAYLSAAVSNIYDKRVYDSIDAADQLSCKPDFAVVVYPGYIALAEPNFALNPAIHPTAGAPPTFILQAEDDPVHVENSLFYFLALKNANVPAELHIYAQGGHGYGLRPRDLPIMGGPKLVETWLHTIKVLPEN
ncbi:MAG: alpha/beta hydrolase [Terracidiphilus sp.]|jgi:acetyl esterase/lipase